MELRLSPATHLEVLWLQCPWGMRSWGPASLAKVDFPPPPPDVCLRVLCCQGLAPGGQRLESVEIHAGPSRTLCACGQGSGLV